MTVILNDERDSELVAGAFDEIREELNVLSVRVGGEGDRQAFGKTSFKPNFRSLGARGLGKVAQELKQAWSRADAVAEHEIARRALVDGHVMRGGVELVRDDVEMTFEPTAGFASASDRIGSVFLETKLDAELRDLRAASRSVKIGFRRCVRIGAEYTDRNTRVASRVHQGAPCSNR